MDQQLSSTWPRIRLTTGKDHDTIDPLTSRLGQSCPSVRVRFPVGRFQEDKMNPQPVVLVVFFVQRRFIEGVTLTGLKG